MKKTFISLFLLCCLAISCTKNNLIDSGLANGEHPDKTIYQYLQSDAYNWDLTVEMIDRAGLQALFKGEDPANPKIMFFGLTSHSIRRWVYKNNKNTIAEMDATQCRNILLNHVYTQVLMRKDIPLRKNGGIMINSLGTAGIQLFTEENVDPIYGVGPLLVKFNSKDLTTVKDAKIASADIHPKNGVVHSMHYDYQIDILK